MSYPHGEEDDEEDDDYNPLPAASFDLRWFIVGLVVAVCAGLVLLIKFLR